MRKITKAICLSLVMTYPAFDSAKAQTASSLFRTDDSVQVAEIVSESGDEFETTGHNGPAVENSHFALRIFFNSSGAVDVYSKSGRGPELRSYKWYPTSEQKESAGAGRDNYQVNNTLGLGGIALWDGSKAIPLEVTKGRVARAGDTKSGSFIEMVSQGVPYKEEFVDISFRIETSSKSRDAVITVKELSKKKVQFVTGVNFHPGETVKCATGYIFTWGVHPTGTEGENVPVGAGLFYSQSQFGPMEVTSDMVRIISVPTSQISYKVVAASTLEAELNNLKRFESYMTK